MVFLAVLVGPARAESQLRGKAVLGATVGRLRAPGSGATSPGFAVGFAFGGRSVVFGPEFIWQNGDSLRVRGIAIAAKIRQPAGWVHPHIVASIGAYAWQSRALLAVPEVSVVGPISLTEVTCLSGSLGAGVTVGRLDRGVSLVLDGRWHRNITQQATAGSRSLVGLMVGVRFGW